MYNPKYRGGDKVPSGFTKFFVMENGHWVRNETVLFIKFPELEAKHLYYIKAT